MIAILLIVVALYTKSLFPIKFQLILKFCPLWFMTGNTGNNLIVSIINYSFANRMTEFTLGRMAA